MALVNQSSIQAGLIDHIRGVLDGHLSEMPSALGSMPSVIKARTIAPRPDFPYVVVDRISSLRGAGDGSWLRDSYIDEETGEVWYKHESRVGMNITCYGENSDGILNQLRVSAVDDLVRADLNSKTGQTFTSYTDITEKPMFIETDYIDGSEMDVFFTAISEWTPVGRGSSVIKSIEVSGNYEDSEATTEIVADSIEL